MKKILLRMLIGLGVLALLGAGVIGFWLFKAFAVTREASRQQVLQQQALVRLDESYPFIPPREGQVLKLSEERLNDYLTIRESSVPLVEALAKRTVELQEEYSKRKNAPSLTATLEASGALLELSLKAHAAYIENLGKHRMSPREFVGLTDSVYALHEQGLSAEKERFRVAEQQGVEKALAQLQARMKDTTLSAEQRSALEMKESQYKAWLKMLEAPSSDKVLSEETKATLQANQELVKKHRLRIAKAYDSNFDTFVRTSASGTVPSTLFAQEFE